MTNKERQSNIELLRILTMFGVIILHYNNKSIGGAMQFVTPYGINYFILIILESVNICAVNLFMLISGYFSYTNTKTTLQKPMRLIIQGIVFSFAWRLFRDIVKGPLTVKSLISGLIPANYFMILYVTVYLLSPYLNLLYERMSRNFIVLIFLLFSIWPTAVEVFVQITEKEWNGLSTIGIYGSRWGIK